MSWLACSAALVAFNGPYVRVMPQRVNFGFCPKGEVRTAIFTVTNMLPIECPVVMVVSSGISGGVFHLSNTQVLLGARERKTISIKCHAGDAEGQLEDELFVVAMSRETHCLTLSATCSQALKVLGSKLDFGPTDIYFSGVEKKLNLTNFDPERPLVVSFRTSTHELSINRMQPVILKPSETRAVPAVFLSALSGARQEHIIAHAPNTLPINIDVVAFSGPAVLFPVMEDIYFPATTVDSSASLRIPITNIGTTNAHIIIFVAAGYPVTIRAMESDFSNRRLNQPNVMVDAKPYETVEHRGIYITLSSRMTMTLELEFRTTVAGFHKIPLVTQLLKPKKLDVAIHNMFFAVATDTLLSIPNAVGKLRQVARMPFAQKITPVSAFVSAVEPVAPAEPPKSPRSNASEVFQLYPPSQTVFGSMSPSRPRETLEFVTLTNITTEMQRYHLVLSMHFETDVALEGDVAPNASIDIPVRLATNLYLTPETRQYMAVGSIVVLDANYNHPGIVSAQLYGVAGDLVSLELRDGVDSILFPSCRVMELQTRKVCIRNKSCFDLVWESSLSMTEATSASDARKTGHAASQQNDVWMPFTISAAKINLKPFEYCSVDLSFSSTQTGDFKCKFGMNYVDPVEHLDDRRQAQRARTKRHLGPWTLECSVGSSDVTHLPEALNFGDIPVDVVSLKPLSLLNTLPLEASVVIAPSKSVMPAQTTTLVPPKSKLELPISFAPLHNAYFADIIAFSVCGTTHSVPVLGYGGIFAVDTNLARPLAVASAKHIKELTPKAEATIDFGLVSTQSPKSKLLLIKNAGTLDVVLTGIAVGDDKRLSWEALDEMEEPTSHDTEPVFGREAPDAPETDWDDGIEKGEYMSTMRIDVEKKSDETQTFAMYNAIAKYDPPALPENRDSIANPIAIFPDKGKLRPGATQTLDVTLTPNLAQYELFATYKLHTEDFADAAIQVHATGASSRLMVDSTMLDFGTLRVGTSKLFKMQLRNRGILHLKYFVECSHAQFHADPEQGALEADGRAELVVKFLPKAIGSIRGHLRITSVSEEGFGRGPIVIPLTGTGSYPELVVLTRLVDFGTALFKNPNRRVIKVQNKGAAEAHVVFSCFHPDISLEMAGRRGLVIEPKETKDVVIVYTPQIVERLDAKAFMRSSDSRGDNFMLTLKGSVGIPRLTITPFDALESLDFGVMRLNKTYRKTFKISNDGNIFLNFKISLTTVSQNQVEVEVDVDHPIRRPMQNVPSPVVVEPKAGTLGVGEETTVTIQFTPTMLVEYEYRISLVYDFQTFNGTIRGIGGRAMLKIDSPLKSVDFGVSRLSRTYVKIVSMSNRGNLGFRYHVRPQPEDGDWSKYDSELAHLAVVESKSRPQTAQTTLAAAAPVAHDDVPFWLEYLTRNGIYIHNPDGNCPARAKVNLIIEFQPKKAGPVVQPMRVYFGDHFEAFNISGCGAVPVLFLRDSTTGQLVVSGSSPHIDIGVHPVNSVYTHLFEVVNDGAFGIDYLVQPMSNAEFDVFPLRGFIEAGSSATLKVFFQPNSENQFHTTLKVLWEGKSLTAHIVGNGGVGRLEVSYMDDKDVLLKGLDFGMVPFNSACEKRFFLLNTGMVGVTAFLEVENEEYTITQFGDPFMATDTKKPRQTPKGLIFSWYNVVKTVLPPNRAVEFGARFLARSATTSVGNITIRSECGSLMIPLKGKGGTISLSHCGDLDFGDISCNYTYSRKVTIVNGGSIPSQLSVEWLVVGHSTEHASSIVKLTENYTPLDPRSGWARAHYLRERAIADTKRQLTAKEYWALIALMVKKTAVKESEIGRSSVMAGRSSEIGLASSSAVTPTGPGSSQGGFSRLGIVAPSVAGQSAKRAGAPAFSMQFKRRQMFYHLITSTQLTSQASSRVRPFVKVDPPISLLPSYGETTFNVELHLGSEDTFLATLLVKSDVPNTPIHEISLTATPKIVNIICDDTRMLNFYRQPLGETEYITRSFTNVGHKDIQFKFVNSNAGLTIVPSKGMLKVGQSVTVTFAFKPLDETIQSADVIFEPNCSQHIRFRMFGGGGYAKASLARYRRFDFGHCMIGKDTVSFLPITNEGNAILHLTRFEIVETDTFFRGQNWPEARVSLFPGKSYNLPLVFNPHEENPTPGRLIIGTNTETYEIELIGLGREAVLIVSKVALEFSECLIGNSYEQKLGLKNIGDVNYPVTFQLEKEFPDVEFYPPSLVIDPFSESFVAISYTPSHETRTTVVFSVSSPYSTHKVPVMVHAGIATLEFNSTELDFGMFERTTRPSTVLSIKNTGTVRTSFHIKDMVKPSMFHISPARGMLPAGKSVNVMVTHTRHEVAQFEERLAVRTDLIDKLYVIRVRGQCEETVLHPDEFSLINMGICPVLEPTTKPLTFRNHGRFPLEYSIKAAYPLKVFPTQGRVLGEESGVVNIQWNPSGGYELRTQVSMITNIGKYQIIVRGKAMFPEIHVNNMYLDFGVCAVGFMYREFFQIENKGKVPVHFTIPPCKDTSYTTSTTSGVLAPKEVTNVEVYFVPSVIGKITSSVIVECKGIHYKEIVVVGVGGRCPFGLRIYETITISNGGDVALFLDFSATDAQQGDCQIVVPEPVTIGPRRSAKCIIGFAASVVGHFSAKLRFNTKEQSFLIPISGMLWTYFQTST
nr:hypothetical protein HK105_008153 [Polyrhizophydium stewartii]